MLKPKQRALLYNETVDPADAVLLMLGGETIEEAFNKGDSLIVTKGGVLQDWHTGEKIDAGDYTVAGVASGYLTLACKKDPKKTWHVNNKAMEAAVAGNEVRFDENLEERGRKPGSVKGHPGQIRAMFKKGHLRKGKSKKTGKPTGKLEYNRNAFPRFQSGAENPWHQRLRRPKPQAEPEQGQRPPV